MVPHSDICITIPTLVRIGIHFFYLGTKMYTTVNNIVTSVEIFLPIGDISTLVEICIPRCTTDEIFIPQV